MDEIPGVVIASSYIKEISPQVRKIRAYLRKRQSWHFHSNFILYHDTISGFFRSNVKMEVSKLDCEIYTVPPRLVLLNKFLIEQVTFVAPTAS